MSATYDPSLTTDRDWVRFTIGDHAFTTEAAANLQNEEIEALLADEENKWLAAAEALDFLRVKWASAGAGVLEKQVSKLRIKKGVDQEASAALKDRVDELRARGARRASPPSTVFRSL